jgi:hypothetical protein
MAVTVAACAGSHYTYNTDAQKKKQGWLAAAAAAFNFYLPLRGINRLPGFTLRPSRRSWLLSGRLESWIELFPAFKFAAAATLSCDSYNTDDI